MSDQASDTLDKTRAQLTETDWEKRVGRWLMADDDATRCRAAAVSSN